MLEDKLRATDWEATNDTIDEQIARESYLQFLKDNEKRNKVLIQIQMLKIKTVKIHLINS